LTAPALSLADALRNRYTLERELGRGGMATVYLALDLRHDRPVALKVLHPELAHALGPERFLREIKLAARLQHPHILSVHDSGEAAGRLWFTMPYVEGESLRDRLTRERQLPVADAVRITREAALALDYAHRHGVIHRDIKPENILLCDRQALVADFGIGRALGEPTPGEFLTETGVVVGTPAYMSPEQAVGDRALDGRSDIYSLGCVLYEMLAGEPPYTGMTPQAVIAKRLSEPAPHVRTVRDVPIQLEQAVTRALARLPGDRHQSGADLAAELEHALEPAPERPAQKIRRLPVRLLASGLVVLLLAAAAWLGRGVLTGPEIPIRASSLAVLPFRVVGEGQQVWREGMVDLLSINLDGAAGLTAVHPRTVLSRWQRDLGSSEAAADQAAALRVAKAVGARYSVTGALLASGPRFRLTAEVQDVQTGDLRGRASVEGPADSVPVLVDRLSLELLRAGLIGKEGADSVIPNAGRLSTTSITALKAYLDGERAFRRSQPEEAEAAFSRAVEADSGFALARFRLAAAKGWTISPHTPTASAEDSAALRVADRLPRRDRQLLRAHLAVNDQDPAAIRMLQELTTSHPEDAEAWYLLGEAYYHTGWLEFAPPEQFRFSLRRAMSRDPGFSPAYLHLAEDAFSRLDSAAAGELIGRLREIAPASPKTSGLSLAYALSWGDSAARRRARVALDTASTLALLTAKHATNIVPDLWRQTHAAALALARQPRHPDFLRAMGYGGAGLAYDLRGRIREAVTLYDSANALEPFPFDYRNVRWLYQASLGLGDSAESERAAKAVVRGRDPQMHSLLAMYHATQHRWAEVERVAALLEQGIREEPGCGRIRARMVRAFAAGHRDGVRAIPVVRELATLSRIPIAGCTEFRPPLRLLLIRLLLEAGRAEEAIPYFNGFEPFWDWDVIAPLEVYRGRVAEELHQRERAIHHYSRFVSWWQEADAHLQPMREEGRKALLRLAGEPRATR
jgi:serine/threonine-protein kinase